MSIRINHIEIPVTPESVGAEGQGKSLPEQIAKILGLSVTEIREVRIVKKSLDARRKNKIIHHYTADVDLEDAKSEEILLSTMSTTVARSPETTSSDPLDGLAVHGLKFRHAPIIIGSGPAGTYAALVLARAGQAAIIVERGEAVESRLRSVNKLRGKGELNPESNYCFGEGGAGTFSDGKLTCGRNHPLVRYCFEEWVKHGAPADILYEAKPHIGTDYLLPIAKSQRAHLESVGTKYLFGRRFTGFTDGGSTARYRVFLDNDEVLETDHLILAIGHSARDTYQMLLDNGLAIVPKPFAMGARIEHPQDSINRIQFGSCAILPPAEYKLAAQAGERGIWTFCMCPGGHLIPTSAQPGHLAINGMSYHARKSGFANAAVVVNVLREDYYRGHALDGMRFQEDLEKRAFIEGGGGYASPAQRLKDFLAARASTGELSSTYRPGINAARLDRILPDFIVNALRAAIKDYDKSMRGYLSDDALVVGLESKTSSPISMMRDRNLQSTSHPGIFPAGEGAGFAGGIVSAALDGVRIGRAVLEDAIEGDTRKKLPTNYAALSSALAATESTLL